MELPMTINSAVPAGPASSAQLGSLPPEVLTTLGLNQSLSSSFQQHILELLTFKGPILRVVSVGKSGDVTRSVQMIISKRA
ncbi:MAG: hypothetical protein Udaeo2_19760 [Candidatus Udaeobacter sp.]|nr:MAG: hypothetical protein Udaeo2_19760 [Candidatus Udaeobacter sp.]